MFCLKKVIFTRNIDDKYIKEITAVNPDLIVANTS